MSVALPVVVAAAWAPQPLEEFVTAGLDGARAQQSPNAAAHCAQGAPAWEHRPELRKALDWLARAQDASGNGGVAGGYGPRAGGGQGRDAWMPVSPRATSGTILTWYFAARHLDRPELAQRAERAARWQVEGQLASGAVQGAVVHTGQALLAWSSAFAETGWGVFAGAARRAGRFLVATLDDDGLWRRGRSSTCSAWALAEAGRRLGAPEFRAAAARHLRAVARLWQGGRRLPDDGLPPRSRSVAPVAAAIRGLLEGARVLGDERLMRCATLAAEHAVAALGREGSVEWSTCPAGQTRLANVWLRLFEITRECRWLEPTASSLRFLQAAQDPCSGGMRARGADGGQGDPSPILSCATKFFVDALIREERIARGLMEPANAGLVA
jgi:hypothetical protein